MKNIRLERDPRLRHFSVGTCEKNEAYRIVVYLEGFLNARDYGVRSPLGREPAKIDLANDTPQKYISLL